MTARVITTNAQIADRSVREIRVANDDGTGVRTLVRASDIPGATALSDRYVDPNGTTVTFEAATPFNGTSAGFAARLAGRS